MFKKRVVTASVLMLVFLVILFFAGAELFIGFASLVFVVGAWEWSSLCGFSSKRWRIAYLAVLAMLGWAAMHLSDGASSTYYLKSILGVACLWWCLALLSMRGFPARDFFWRPMAVRATIGVFVLIPSWLSVLFLRQYAQGEWMVLLVLLIVAAADVGAYFAGRRFGRLKLAPGISPGKSWEGVAGGVLLALAVSTGFVAMFDIQKWSLGFAVVVLFMVLMSVVGDLLESIMKRVHGVKDSGSILPGHGGVLDRIDGLVAALPLLTLVLLISGWQLS